MMTGVTEEKIYKLQEIKVQENVRPINIDFSNISYTVQTSDGSLQLLHKLCGQFQAGKLSAVLGPSGAGKTLLLNILVGYNINCDDGGSVLVNGSPRKMYDYRNMCRYIMQDSLLQPQLTTWESMMIASQLKSAGLTEEMRKNDVQRVLDTLGIVECVNTRSEVLSGSERKRLCIALEMLSNPSILFFDEPVTGLDNHAAKLVMKALRKLTDQGRTVICTVHQPSPLEFQSYDYAYFIAKGTCVFSGPPKRLVTFLDGANFPCPITYSPADYIIELVQMNSQSVKHLAASATKEQIKSKSMKRYIKYSSQGDSTSKVPRKKPYTTPVSTKILVLLCRMFLQHWRNPQRSTLYLLTHIISGIFIGVMFFGMGNDANHFFHIGKLSGTIVIFCVFPSVFIHIMHVPFQICILKQEHFNNWYDEFSYYIALTISSMPFTLASIILYALPIYFLSYQPLEIYRVLYFISVCCFSAVCSEGLGTLIGTLVNVRTGCILGPALLGALYALSCYGMHEVDAIEPFWAVLIQFSFMRHVQIGCWISFFGLNRQPLDCSDIYCYWSDPTIILRNVGIVNTSHWLIFGSLVANTVVFRLLSYYAIRYRLRTKVSGLSYKLHQLKKLCASRNIYLFFVLKCFIRK